MFLEDLCCLLAFVHPQVIENDDGAPLKARRKHLLDAGIKGLAIEGTWNDPRSHDACIAQARDQRLVCPVSERGFAKQARAIEATTASACQLCVRAGLIEKDEAFEVLTHEGEPFVDPELPRLSDRWFVAFPGDKAFFYIDILAWQALHRWN